MSLLLNLLNYSSSLGSEMRLSLDKEDERSRSLYHDKLKDQQNQKSRMSSRSLSKIMAEKPQAPIDPKTRILHRISHLLSMKCKKHYYTFWVILETLRKKNLRLNIKGEFEKNQSNIQLPKQVSTIVKKQNIMTQKNIRNFVQKIEEKEKLILIKEFQKHHKSTFFSLLKHHYFYQDKLNVFTQKVQKFIKKQQQFCVIKKLKKINQFAFKIQILSSLVESLNKKYCKIKANQEKTIKSQSFLKLKSFSIQQQQSYEKSTLINVRQNKNLHNEAKINQIKDLMCDKVLEFQKTDKQSQKNEKKSNVSIEINDPIESLQDRIQLSKKRKIQRNQLSMLKSLKIKVQTNQEPFAIVQGLKYDKNSTFCTKLPKNYLCFNPNDQSELRTSLNHHDQKQVQTNRFKQSQVTELFGRKVHRVNSKVNSSAVNNNWEKVNDFDISNISGISLLKTDKSTSTIVNEQKFNLSTFGGEAVNFKNSLVQERQSLKNTERDFIKKLPKFDQQKQGKNLVQHATNNKQFLRNTLSSKKDKNYSSTTSNKAFSKDKSIGQSKKDTFLTDTKPTNKFIDFHWNRPSSSDRPKRQDRLIYAPQHEFFSNTNISLFSNHTVYPTRDNSTLVSHETSARGINIALESTFKPERSQKQRSYIKLMSKKQHSFLKSGQIEEKI